MEKSPIQLDDLNVNKFHLTQEQLDEVAKIIKTNHFLLAATDPELIENHWSGDIACQNLSNLHLSVIAEHLCIVCLKSALGIKDNK